MIKGEMMFCDLTLTETVGIFAAILLDLRVQLCYDSIKTCHTFKGLTDARDKCDVKTIILLTNYKIQTGSKHTSYNKHNFLFATVAALQRFPARGIEKLVDHRRYSRVGGTPMGKSPYFGQ